VLPAALLCGRDATRNAPARIAGVFFFGCNMDPSGTKNIDPGPIQWRISKPSGPRTSSIDHEPIAVRAFVEAHRAHLTPGA